MWHEIFTGPIGKRFCRDLFSCVHKSSISIFFATIIFPCHRSQKFWKAVSGQIMGTSAKNFLWVLQLSIYTRAVRNCSFRFDINISGWQAFISKPISKSKMWKLYFETNTENKIALWAISISITISISKSPIFGWYFETISISKPIFYYISPPKGWP